MNVCSSCFIFCLSCKTYTKRYLKRSTKDITKQTLCDGTVIKRMWSVTHRQKPMQTSKQTICLVSVVFVVILRPGPSDWRHDHSQTEDTTTLRLKTRPLSDWRHDHSQTEDTITLRLKTRPLSDCRHDHSQTEDTITLRLKTRSLSGWHNDYMPVQAHNPDFHGLETRRWRAVNSEQTPSAEWRCFSEESELLQFNLTRKQSFEPSWWILAANGDDKFPHFELLLLLYEPLNSMYVMYRIVAILMVVIKILNYSLFWNENKQKSCGICFVFPKN